MPGSTRKNPKVTISSVAIGAEKSELTLMIGQDVTTAHHKHRMHLEASWQDDKKGKPFDSVFNQSAPITVQQIPLETYLTDNHVPTQFDVLIVDVEGHEWEVLRNWDITKWQPKMAIIELHDMHPQFQSPEIKTLCHNVATYFAKADYHIVYKDTRNTIFVHKRFWE